MALKTVGENDKVILKGSTYNVIQKAVDAYLRERDGRGAGAAANSHRGNSAVIQVRNQTGAVVPWCGVVELVSPATTAAAAGWRTNDVVDVDLPQTASIHLAITRESIPIGALGLASVTGLSKVQVNVSNANHRYAKPINNDVAKLASSYFEEPFRIISVEPGTGIKWALVEFHPCLQNMSYVARTNSGAIPAGGSGNVGILENGVLTGESVLAYLEHWHGGQPVSVGKDIEVTYYRNEGKWRITQADCEA